MDDKCTTCPYKVTMELANCLDARTARGNGKTLMHIHKISALVAEIQKAALDKFETMLVEKAKWKTSGNQNGICASDIVKIKCELMKEMGI